LSAVETALFQQRLSALGDLASGKLELDGGRRESRVIQGQG
jgi:hypothetical protein